MLKDQPLASRLEQRKELLDNNLRRRDAAETLHSDDGVNALLLKPALGLQLLGAAADDLVDVAQAGLGSVLAQCFAMRIVSERPVSKAIIEFDLLHPRVRLNPINFRNARITRLGEQTHPLPRSGPNIQTHALRRILEQGHDMRGCDLARPRSEEDPEAREPGVLEVIEGKEGGELEGGEEVEDGGDEVVVREGKEE